ncbi:MAG: hypothetical protein ABSH12_00380 [Endomicrobiales bacterium]|jgi:hypothetical protein
MKEAKKSESVGVFRYGVIAPALHMSGGDRRKYFEGLAGKELDVPHYGIKRYKTNTFRNWLVHYKNGGLDNLKPVERSDKGVVRRITEAAAASIKGVIAEFPFLSASGVYRVLQQRGIIRSGDFGETTLRNYIKRNSLRGTGTTEVGRKKYEKEHVNELWVGDFLLCGAQHKRNYVALKIMWRPAFTNNHYRRMNAVIQ